MRVEPVRTGAPGLVLIHGIGGNRCSWDAVRAVLGNVHSPLAIDLPGHGARRHQRFDLAVALEGVDDALRDTDGPIVLVGWSLGGYVALAYASRRPERVEGIVLIGSSLIPNRAVKALFRAATVLAPLVEVGAARRLIRGIARRRYGRRAVASTLACGIEPGSGLRALRVIARSDVGRWLDGVRYPALVINGANDRLFRWQEQAFARRLGRARVRTIEGIGHFAPLTAPEVVAEAVGAFLEQLGEIGSATP